jgi:hypothetical protein
VSAPSVLRDQQFAFAAHLRDPASNPPPAGLEDRRVQVYRELVYNNLEALLAGAFPVLRRTLDDAAWHALVRAFLRDWRAQTPLFPELPREFVRFCEQRAADGAGDPPWLPELAHYEWIEVALEYAEAEPLAAEPDLDALASPLQVSPVAWPLAYAWPVHRIGPGFRPQAPPAEPTCLVVQRDAAGRVRFHEVGAVALHLLERIGTHTGATGVEHLHALARAAGAEDGDAFAAQATPLLRGLAAAGIVGRAID